MGCKIDYTIQVWCSHCGEAHYRIDCKIIPNWGYKCPDCGGKCRVKPKYQIAKRLAKHPYVRQTGKPHQYVKEIRELGKRERLVEAC